MCGFTVDTTRGKGCVKKLLLAWLFFAITSKLVALYFLATLPYASLWEQARALLRGTFWTSSTVSSEERMGTLCLSSAFEVSGLGNIMFQYASLYGLSKTLKRTAVIPDMLRINAYFALDAEVRNQIRPGVSWMQFPERKASAFDANLVAYLAKADRDAELVGFFQSWMYFKLSQNDVRKQFTITEKIQSDVDTALRDVVSDMKIGPHMNGHHRHTLVGVHIRRGDMATEHFSHYGYTTAGADYLEKAMAHFEHRYSNIVYIVCSDDINWCERNMNVSTRDVYFSQGHGELVDLGLLARCDHSIMTVGTFGWWAAFLAGGEVTYYKRYPARGSSLQRAFSKDKSDYFLPHWTGI